MMLWPTIIEESLEEILETESKIVGTRLRPDSFTYVEMWLSGAMPMTHIYPTHTQYAEEMAIVYRRAMAFLDRFVPSRFQPVWQHPAGPKTVFFWAPIFKWGLVIAGISDLKRPVEKLSVTQSTALAATGTIWSRYSLVIIPKNWFLFSVNVFVGLTGCYQVSRIIRYRMSLKEEPQTAA